MAILEQQPAPFLRLDRAYSDFLQSRFAAFIIAQSQFHKGLVGKTSFSFGNKFSDIVGHGFKVAQMENGQSQISKQQFTGAVAYLLRESFEGSPEGQPSAFLDRGVGLFSTLDSLSAADVSKYVAGTTVASHTEHAKFYLDRLCEFINGRAERVNWEDSWLIETVNDDEWDALRQSVRNSYENLLRCLASVEDWTEDRTGMAIGMVAHTAYHLGAIRQIAKSV